MLCPCTQKRGRDARPANCFLSCPVVWLRSALSDRSQDLPQFTEWRHGARSTGFGKNHLNRDREARIRGDSVVDSTVLLPFSSISVAHRHPELCHVQPSESHKEDFSLVSLVDEQNFQGCNPGPVLFFLSRPKRSNLSVLPLLLCSLFSSLSYRWRAHGRCRHRHRTSLFWSSPHHFLRSLLDFSYL